jgi:hypothetical protein
MHIGASDSFGGFQEYGGPPDDADMQEGRSDAGSSNSKPVGMPDDGRLTREEFEALKEQEKQAQKQLHEQRKHELNQKRAEKTKDQQECMKSDARVRAQHWADNLIKDVLLKLPSA